MEIKEYIDHLKRSKGLKQFAAVDYAAKSLCVTRCAVYFWLKGARATPEMAKKLMEMLARHGDE